ncbi:MAG: hypothetical protein QM704_01155 [Anaeromyxobacteraceae bacterium]
MTSREHDALVEEAATAFRPRDPGGRLRPHPAFLDLDAAGRAEAHARAATSRALEAALDPEGLSTTARAILARLG